MTLLVLFQSTYVEPTVYTDQYLRYDDMALVTFLQNQLRLNGFEHVEVIDGYPNDKNLSIPTIAVEHIKTIEKKVELGNDFEKIERQYTIDIYARSKGERDDLNSFLAALIGRGMTTVDDRYNTIDRISHAGDIHRLGWLVTQHGKYYRIEFDGVYGHGAMPHDSAYITNALSIDMDVMIASTPEAGETQFLFDKYNETFLRGFKVYIETPAGGGNVLLKYDVGVGLTTFSMSHDINDYLNERVQISVTMEFTGSAMLGSLWINGVKVEDVEVPWYLSVNTGDKDITIGSFRNDTTGNLSNSCHMYLYGMKITNALESYFGRTGEYLLPNRDSDLSYLVCNEGDYSSCFDKSGQPTRNMVLDGCFYWRLYLRDETKRSKFEQSVNTVIVRGLRNINGN